MGRQLRQTVNGGNRADEVRPIRPLPYQDHYRKLHGAALSSAKCAAPTTADEYTKSDPSPDSPTEAASAIAGAYHHCREARFAIA
jgi:hypothetical protein